MDSNWKAAIDGVHTLMEENEEFLSTIYQIAKVNEAQTNQTIFEQALAETALSSYDEYAIDVEFLRSTAKDIHRHFGAADMSAFVEEREELVRDYDKHRSTMHLMSRTFGDIVRNGPRNEAEEVLLVAATAFLEPHEFKKAVTGSLPPGKVADMIDASRVKQFTDIIMQSAGVERVHSAQEQVDAPMPNILGEKMGVMDSIQHSFETTSVVQDATLDEVKAPKTPPVETEKGMDGPKR